MGLLMEGELFHETLDLVQGTFCHVLLLPKNNVYCITRSPHQEVCLRDNPAGQKCRARLEKKHRKGKALTI